MTAVDPQMLREVPAFASLTDDECIELAVIMSPFAVDAGETLFVQDELAGPLYIVVEGAVELRRRAAGDLETIDVAGPGEILGSFGSTERDLRSATARAVEPTRGYTLLRSAFEHAIAAHRPAAFAVLRPLGLSLARRARKVVDAQATSQVDHLDQSAPPEDWSVAETAQHRAQLASLGPMRSYTSEELDHLLEGARWLEVPRGTILVQRGGARFLAIVVRGAVQSSVPTPEEDLLHLALKGPGETMGEIAALDGGTQPTLYRARERSTIVKLDGERLDQLLQARDPAGFRLLEAVVKTLWAAVRDTNHRLVHVRAQTHLRAR